MWYGDPRGARRAYRDARRQARWAQRNARRNYRYGPGFGFLMGPLFVTLIIFAAFSHRWQMVPIGIVAIIMITVVLRVIGAFTSGLWQSGYQPSPPQQQPYQAPEQPPIYNAVPHQEPYQPYGEGYQPSQAERPPVQSYEYDQYEAPRTHYPEQMPPAQH